MRSRSSRSAQPLPGRPLPRWLPAPLHHPSAPTPGGCSGLRGADGEVSWASAGQGTGEARGAGRTRAHGPPRAPPSRPVPPPGPPAGPAPGRAQPAHCGAGPAGPRPTSGVGQPRAEERPQAAGAGGAGGGTTSGGGRGVRPRRGPRRSPAAAATCSSRARAASASLPRPLRPLRSGPGRARPYVGPQRVRRPPPPAPIPPRPARRPPP